MGFGFNVAAPFTVDGQDPFRHGLPNITGKWWYVNGGSGTGSPIAGSGADGLTGDSWGQAFLTMNKVFTHPDFHSGDGIQFKGNVREQLSTPAGVFDVAVVGASTVTRHPDAHGADVSWGGYSSARWNAPASPTATTPLVRVRQQGWRFLNALFTGDSSNDVDCIEFFRDAGSGDAEDDASHGWVQGCRFQGGRNGIVQSGGVARLRILENEFLLFSNSGDCAIRASGLAGDAGVGTGWGWQIIGNDFLANETDIYGRNLSGPRITDNHFHLNGLGVTNTIAIDMTGGSEELVARNFMYCASDEASVVNARFVATATGIWGPNYYSDKEEYGEPAE